MQHLKNANTINLSIKIIKSHKRDNLMKQNLFNRRNFKHFNFLNFRKPV